MSTLSTRRLQQLLRDLEAAAAERSEDQRQLAEQHDRAVAESKARRDKRRRDVDEAYEAERDGLDSDYDGRRAMLTAAHDAERGRAQGEYKTRRTRAEAHAAKTAKLAAEQRKEAAWEILTLYDSNKDKPRHKRDTLRKRLMGLRRDLDAIQADAISITHQRGIGDAAYDPPEALADAAEPSAEAATDSACDELQARCEQAVEAAREAAQAVYDQRLAGRLDGPLPAGLFVGALATVLTPAGFAWGWDDWRAYALGIGVAGCAAAMSFVALRPKVKRQTAEGFADVCEALGEAHRLCHETEALAIVRAKAESEALQQRRDADLKELGFRMDQLVGKASAESEAEVAEISQLYPARLAEMRDKHEQQTAEFEAEYDERVAELTRRRDERVARIDADHASDLKTIEDDHQTGWRELYQRWITRYDDLRAELRDMRAESQRLFPDFATTEYGAGPAATGDGPSAWLPPSQPPAAITFGELEIDLAELPDGLADDDRLNPPRRRLAAPATMALAEHPTLLVTAAGEGRRHAVELLRLMMLRFLTAMPPGKVRFTILDPVGLGENFQAFMHLADADDQLIAGRIWSEPRDIDEQLTRLTTHMETVLQKYLRSEYESIHEYNAQAGEVAEPFQVLVAAGFPSNFTESAGRRLVSLVTGGPRCGVYTLLGVDTAARLPTDFRLDELKPDAAWLDWVAAAEGEPGRFVWRYPGLDALPLTIDPEPPVERGIEVIRRAGIAAKAAVRVEVPFSVVEPAPDDYWTATCDDELRVPIGRAGAKNVQDVRLGKGTSQHLLVAGKTGSGKSTFLHALVTSAAMHYSPDEVEFYLVDFKKGVEFKSYATHRLPHARVIAIESEREFGLSVLERLDEELRVRGERFRDAGVQNLADYRRARPDEKTPACC